MRILLVNHLPFSASPSGESTAQLAAQLLAAGHQVRCLVVDQARTGAQPAPTRRLVCSLDEPDADLAFAAPILSANPNQVGSFSRLSDWQLNAYREALRLRLDAEVDAFDPEVVHCQHIWLPAHLVLETGVPYVISTYSDELVAYRQDHRYWRFVEEAAENAARLLAASRAIRSEVLSLFGVLSERVLLEETLSDVGGVESVGRPGDISPLVALYESVRNERTG